STIDLALETQKIVRRLVSCKINNKIYTNSDHLPIKTSININIPETQATPRRNWTATDTEKLRSFVAENLYHVP
ncbi:hypothetical protein BP00DRAFT_356653, partial [Aspergillus indologenus CBS 114.80]